MEQQLPDKTDQKLDAFALYELIFLSVNNKKK
jgi:hypothetical protein